MQSESLPLPEVEFIEFGTDQWKQKLFGITNAPAVSETFIGQRSIKFDGRNAGELNSQQVGRAIRSSSTVRHIRDCVVYDYDYDGAH